MSRSAESGQAVVVIAVMLTVLVGMTAVALDGSRAYSVRRALQDAVDAAALAAGDSLQSTGSYATAEQAATALFGRNMALYGVPSCAPGYGAPAAAAWTVTCTYPDGTRLTDIARALGPQGGRFTITATRQLQLQFGRVLTNGTSPSLGATADGSVSNLVFSPALGALSGAGCGGTSGSAITVNGTGTLNLTGDVVADGRINVVAGAVRVAGDVYARCQPSIAGSTTACYPSGAATPCTFPDVAGATRSGFRLPDAGYPAPAGGAGFAFPTGNVVVPPGVYLIPVVLNSGRCWFLSGGVYEFLGGATNNGDFVSNELKPPSEPDTSNNTVVATHQFWNSGGVNCAGSFQATAANGANGLSAGTYGVVVTSVRSDNYAGVGYSRESAPSACQLVSITPGHVIRVLVSNVPGAASYNVYFTAKNQTCAGPFGLGGSIPVAMSPQNDQLAACPQLSGTSCSLGNETATFDSTAISGSFAPNPLAAADTFGAYAPDPELPPLAGSLPDQNPARGALAAGDRANEDRCSSVGGGFATCPGPVTPGAVEMYFPSGSCLTLGSSSDTFVFSGYQYDWISVYEPPGNTCTNGISAESNSAFVGLFYAPGATVNLGSQFVFEGRGTGGILAASVNFAGTLPAIRFSANYAPVPPAARLT
jgi:Putative Flp pilus-assembly TadE/G-like